MSRSRAWPCTVEASSPAVYGCAGAPSTSRHRAALDDAAGIHDRDAVGDLGSDAEIVRHEDHAHAQLALQPPQQDQHLHLHGRVERRRRLVGEQQARLARQRHRDHRALPQAARQFVRVGVEPALRGRDAHEVEQLQRPGARRQRGRPRYGGARPRRSAVRSCRPDRARSSAPGRSSRQGRRESRATAIPAWPAHPRRRPARCPRSVSGGAAAAASAPATSHFSRTRTRPGCTAPRRG